MSVKAIALGYKRDVHDARDYGPEKIFGAARPAVIVPASMREFRVGSLLQGRASSCVSHALDRGIDMNLRYELKKAGKSGVVPPKASRRFMYYNARRQEEVDARAAGHHAPAIVDGGSYPRLAMRAVQKLGFCPEQYFPYSDDPVKINEAPPPEAFAQAYDQSGFTYARIDTLGDKRIADVAKGLAIGAPTIIGTFVDTAFMNWDGKAAIDKIDANDPNGGGHMMCVLEVTSTEVVIDNWWGDDWGDGGVARFTHRLFGSTILTDLYMIKAVPTFSQDTQEGAA